MGYVHVSIVVSYMLAAFFRYFEKISGKPMTWHGGVPLVVGLVLHLVGVRLIFLESQAASAFQLALTTFAAGGILAGACLFLEWKTQDTFFSLFLLPLAIPLVIVSSLWQSFLPGPMYQGGWFLLHVLFSVSGECFFFLAGLSGLIYLFAVRRLKKKNQLRAVRFFPPLTRLDSMIAWFGLAGFILFTVGLASGAVWSYWSFASLRVFDTKRLLSFVVWMIFGVLLVGRHQAQWAGSRVASLAIAGFLFSLSLILAGGTKTHWYP